MKAYWLFFDFFKKTRNNKTFGALEDDVRTMCENAYMEGFMDAAGMFERMQTHGRWQRALKERWHRCFPSKPVPDKFLQSFQKEHVSYEYREHLEIPQGKTRP